jgi:hypothetical protein
METTAEGIEYMDQLELIRGLRVSHVQGWVYSKAISSDELALRLADGNWTIAPSGPATQRCNRQAVYRKVGLIHGSRYRSAIMRNLSASGALIDGLEPLPRQSLVIVDFGDGQLTFARVARVNGRQMGIVFEQELVDDGNGGLCTGTASRPTPWPLPACQARAIPIGMWATAAPPSGSKASPSGWASPWHRGRNRLRR